MGKSAYVLPGVYAQDVWVKLALCSNQPGTRGWAIRIHPACGRERCCICMTEQQHALGLVSMQLEEAQLLAKECCVSGTATDRGSMHHTPAPVVCATLETAHLPS